MCTQVCAQISAAICARHDPELVRGSPAITCEILALCSATYKAAALRAARAYVVRGFGP